MRFPNIDPKLETIAAQVKGRLTKDRRGECESGFEERRIDWEVDGMRKAIIIQPFGGVGSAWWSFVALAWRFVSGKGRGIWRWVPVEARPFEEIEVKIDKLLAEAVLRLGSVSVESLEFLSMPKTGEVQKRLDAIVGKTLSMLLGASHAEGWPLTGLYFLGDATWYLIYRESYGFDVQTPGFGPRLDDKRLSASHVDLMSELHLESMVVESLKLEKSDKLLLTFVSGERVEFSLEQRGIGYQRVEHFPDRVLPDRE